MANKCQSFRFEQKSICTGKGYVVKATKAISTGDIICEYKGELLTDQREIDMRLESYKSRTREEGQFMFYFAVEGKQHW